jgi:hypothetical protein
VGGLPAIPAGYHANAQKSCSQPSLNPSPQKNFSFCKAFTNQKKNLSLYGLKDLGSGRQPDPFDLHTSDERKVGGVRFDLITFSFK